MRALSDAYVGTDRLLGDRVLTMAAGKGAELGFVAVLTSLCHSPSAVRCGFCRLEREHFAARDPHREP
jgi:hypothetical protein